MNIIEQMLMAAIHSALEKLPKGQEVETEQAHRRVLGQAATLDPSTTHAILFLAAHKVVNEETQEEGIGLAVGMSGGENVLMLLTEGAQRFLTVQHMKLHHADELAADPVLQAILEGSDMEAVRVEEHFAPASAKH